MFIFQSKFNFVDSFQITPVVSGDPVLQNLELAVHIIVYPQRLFRFHFHNDVCVCHGNAVLYECGRSEFICNQWERKGMHTDIYFSS